MLNEIINNCELVFVNSARFTNSFGVLQLYEDIFLSLCQMFVISTTAILGFVLLFQIKFKIYTITFFSRKFFGSLAHKLIKLQTDSGTYLL